MNITDKANLKTFIDTKVPLIRDILESQPDLDPLINEAVNLLLQLLDVTSEESKKLKNTLNALATEMNIHPKSEKKPLKDRIKTRTPEEQVEWHKKKAIYHSVLAKRKEKDICMKIKEDINKNIEEKINDDFEEVTEGDENYGEKLKDCLNRGCDIQPDGDPNCENAAASVFAPVEVFKKEDTAECEVTPEQLGTEEIGDDWYRSSQTRRRCDFSLQVTDVEVEVETLTHKKSGQRVHADTTSIGPKGSQLTWNSILNIIILVCGYAFPMARLAKLLGSRIFKVPNMVRILDGVATKLSKVYLHMLTNKLANARVIQGDDAVTRVSEVRRYKKTVQEAIQNKKEVPPPEWKESSHLARMLAGRLGFHHSLKKGEGYKTKLFTTVATAMTDESDPYSRVVIYRTHFGSFGNLLSTIFAERDERNKKIVIVSDLFGSNNVSPDIKAKFEITQAGCSAHARRPFKRYYSDDPELCDIILSGFEGIAHTETMLNSHAHGRNRYNVVATREFGSLDFWENNKDLADAYTTKWSNSDPLGKACRYLVKNHAALTYYIHDAFVPPHNNLCEQLLRFEALEDASSFGRDTLEGRARFDIIRSLIDTCQFVQVSVRTYFLYILLSDEVQLQKHPELYTPRAFRRMVMQDDSYPVFSSEIFQRPEYLSAQKVAFRAQKVNVSSLLQYQ